MMQKSSEAQEWGVTGGERAPKAAEADEEWFAAGERASSVPPRSTRRPRALSTPRPEEPAESLGDTIADHWFR